MSTEQSISDFIGDYDAEKFSSVSCLYNKKIVIYGAGSGFFTFSSFILDKYKLKPYLVLDIKFDTGETFNDINTCSPMLFKPTKNEQDNSIVVITVGSLSIYKDIKKLLKNNLGFQHIVWANDIFEYSLHHTPIEYINNIPDELIRNYDKIISAYSLFHDETSKNIYKKILAIYFYKKSIKIPHNPIDEQYFPKDILLVKGYSRFIDCGAYIGDTIEQIGKIAKQIEMLVCFEPDAVNYKKLLKNIDFNIAKQVITFPCGLYNTEKTLKVSSNDTNSSISNTGDILIQTVAIDHVIHGIKPTFIKMDIEGAELEALEGAINTIKESEADLAISVYHLVNHIWDIPHLINNLGVGYKLFLRNYTSYVAETVLYATKD